MLDKEFVLEELKKIKYPGFSRDIVSFGLVKDLYVGEGEIHFKMDVTETNHNNLLQTKAEAEKLLSGLEGVREVKILLQVKNQNPKPTSQGHAPDRTNPIAPLVKYKIAVASGKGGVGKSTVSVNLAIALQKSGFKVAIFDSDIYGPSIAKMMNVEGQKPHSEDGKNLEPIENYGLKMISMAFFAKNDSALIWRGPMIQKAIEQFLRDVIWEEQDFMIIDLPPGTGDAQLTFSQVVELQGAVIVTTPQNVALRDAYKGVSMFQKVGVPISGIVENMSYYECSKCHEQSFIFSSGGGKKAAEELGVPLLGEIPIDTKIRIGGDKGEPIMISEPDSLIAKEFMKIA
ncbi:Mrp/NBP35 family ATP-binding protein, partial [bacterium]|nr:Mrp/NBP35 family ATP-binding protein [bacterium]